MATDSRGHSEVAEQHSEHGAEEKEFIFRGLERFGLAPILLLGLFYFAHTGFVQPLFSQYTKMVSSVADNNALIKEAMAELADIETTNKMLNIRIQELSEQNRVLNAEIRLIVADILKKVEELQK